MTVKLNIIYKRRSFHRRARIHMVSGLLIANLGLIKYSYKTFDSTKLFLNGPPCRRVVTLPSILFPIIMSAKKCSRYNSQ